MNNPERQIITGTIIGAAFEVRTALGPFLGEDNYQEALQLELALRGLHVEREWPIPVIYKGHRLGKPKLADLIVENEIILELKALREMGSWEVRQLMCYLELANRQIGMLINFGAEDFSVGTYSSEYPMNKGIYRLYNAKA